MSTNKTTNYQLHSWLPSDEFHLTEINENFTALDAALKAEAGSAAQKQAALETALGERVRMVTGGYNGSSQTTITVELGFKPKAVVIINTRREVSSVDLSFLAVENGINNDAVTLTETGFIATNISRNGAYMNYPAKYHYAAFY